MVDQKDLVFELPALSPLGKCLDVPDGEGHQEAHHHDVHHDDEGEHERVGEQWKVVLFPSLFDPGSVDDQLLGILQIVIFNLPRHHHENLEGQD